MTVVASEVRSLWRSVNRVVAVCCLSLLLQAPCSDLLSQLFTVSVLTLPPLAPYLPPFHPADEAERSLHDALCVLTETIKETRVVCGGGCMEMHMASEIDK